MTNLCLNCCILRTECGPVEAIASVFVKLTLKFQTNFLSCRMFHDHNGTIRFQKNLADV